MILVISLLILVNNQQHTLEQKVSYSSMQECEIAKEQRKIELEQQIQDQILGYALECKD